MLLMMLQLVTTFVIYKNIKSYEFMELISVDLDEVGQLVTILNYQLSCYFIILINGSGRFDLLDPAVSFLSFSIDIFCRGSPDVEKLFELNIYFLVCLAKMEKKCLCIW